MHLAVRALFVACLVAPSLALAQSYPSKPIRMIVPIPAGSLLDILGRGIAQSISPTWGQPIVVENRAGANGTLGMEACSKSPGDGYTICVPDGNIMTLNPHAYSHLPYDPFEFVPVIHLGDLEQSIVIKASLPVKSVRELMEYARARPGQVTWGSAGAGSTMHLYLEWFQAKTGVKFNHVPYKGPQELVRAMASGEVEATNLSTYSVAPFVKEGKLRMLAVVAGKLRSPYAGDTPSLAEQGYDLDFRNWVLLVMPRGTPMEIARRWNADINRLLADKPFVDKIMTAQAMTVGGGTPEDLTALLKRKMVLGAELAKMANLKYD
jgi:tripartite-type tricarboxylate transporter receptor subunit TctC